MADGKKNYDWIDTIRVLSTLLIIIFHYGCILLENPNLHETMIKYCLGLGHIGVAAFFGISGYLVVNSLDRSKSVLDFYRRKIIRVILPFTAIYILAVVALFFLNVIKHPFIPMFFSEAMIVGLVPIDLNITKFFNVPHFFIIGEWFIGTIIWMYLVAPPIYKLLKKNVALTLIVSIIVACMSVDFFMDLQMQNRIFNVQTIFIVRLPEFILGMILFLYKDKIFKPAPMAVGIALTVAMILYSAFSDINTPTVLLKYFYGEGTDLHLILALMFTVYASFIIAHLLNKYCSAAMKPINNFKDISYMVILVHHIIIHLFNKVFTLTMAGGLKAFLLMLLLILVVVFASIILRKIYTPFEKKLLG